MKKLLDLRRRVKSIDQELIKSIHQRLKLTEEIGEEKRRLGLPLRDWSVEKGVIKNGIEFAGYLGLDKNLVKSIIAKLIEHSRIQQERLHYSAYTGDREDILIIGGLGAMGRWFAYFFQNQGHRVSIYDTKRKGLKDFPYYRSLPNALKDKSCALIATPLRIVPEIIEKISELKYRGLIFDIASVKTHIIPAIKRAIKNGIKITSIHPMYGPSSRTLADKIICLCSCGCVEADKKVFSFFKDTASTLISLSFDEHDRLISYVLGLSHLINILFIKMLIASGYKFENFKKIASTTFYSQLVTTISVIRENPELYYEIQSLNPYQRVLFNNLKNNLDSLIEIISSGNKNIFNNIFKNGSRWLNEYQD